MKSKDPGQWHRQIPIATLATALTEFESKLRGSSFFHVTRTTQQSWRQVTDEKSSDLSIYLPRILQLIRLRGMHEADSARRISPEAFHYQTFHDQHHKKNNEEKHQESHQQTHQKNQKAITLEVDSINVEADSMTSNKSADVSALRFRIRHRARLRAAQWHLLRS